MTQIFRNDLIKINYYDMLPPDKKYKEIG